MYMKYINQGIYPDSPEFIQTGEEFFGMLMYTICISYSILLPKSIKGRYHWHQIIYYRMYFVIANIETVLL